MIPSNPVPQVCNYGTSATYRDLPNEEQLRNGVVPLDSLPAAWWNCMWNMTNGAINCARYAAGVLIDEVNTVLAQAGVCVNCGCVDQLYQAINKIRQTIGTAAVAGAVKSSSTASEVAIDPTTGIMSVNCLGNAASLTTTAATVVGAINELKSTYDTCWSNNATALSGKAPTNHASTTTGYGVGTASNYGHLKISDVYNNANCQGTDIAASQKAVYCAWKVASDAAAGNISLGNTNGCALGTASAGTAITAARSDHVHPKPTWADLGLGTAAACAAGCFRASTWTPSCVACAGLVYLDTYTASADRPVMIASPRGSTGFSDQGVSTTCCFTFNPATGLLCAKTFCGAVYGCACCAGRNGSGVAFGTAAACDATAFRASDWWPDNVTCGCVCYADSAWSACTALQANHAFCTRCLSLKGKWCCICSPGPGICCVRLYVCNVATGNYMIFPGGCFAYIPLNARSCVSASAMLASITAANTWAAVGPSYSVSHLDCISPECTTKGDIPAIRVW